MRAHFDAFRDVAESLLFGPVRKDHTFECRGLIHYDLRDGQFAVIRGANKQPDFYRPPGRGHRARHPALRVSAGDRCNRTVSPP
jgi:hypothetical protein